MRLSESIRHRSQSDSNPWLTKLFAYRRRLTHSQVFSMRHFLFTRRCYPWDFAFKKSASLGANWTLQATLNWIIYHGAKRNLPWIWSENGSLKAAINQGFFFLSDISIASPLYFPKPNQFKLGVQSHICSKKFMNAWTNVEKFHCTHPKIISIV